MPKRLYNRLASLTFGLWLLGAVLLLLAVGSFIGGGEASAMNDLPLFVWLREAPFALSWWLWLAIAFLALLFVNTVLCSIESLRAKAGRERFFVLISPQVMHLGFLLIVLAHLASAYGGRKEAFPALEGQVIEFPDGGRLEIGRITATIGPMGMPADMGAEVRSWQGGTEKRAIIGPNHPLFCRGFGIYLKQVEPGPVPVAYLEAHREPGASLALAGAILFTAGNLGVLVWRRRG